MSDVALASACPLCAAQDLAVLLDRAPVPVFQNALAATASAAREVTTGTLALRICRACGFVFNAAFDPALVRYNAAYENDQTLSGVFSAHVDAMAREVLSSLAAIASPTVLEVGCGQGVFLQRLCRVAEPPVGLALGFDPAWRGGSVPPPLRLYDRFFDAAAAAELGVPIHAVISRHVIEHVEDPVGFLQAIRAALPAGMVVKLFLETPCVEWILRRVVLQDFFYEHCSYFTTETLSFALRRAGFANVTVRHVFEGQYLWAAATSTDHPEPAPPRPLARDLVTLAERFASASQELRHRWHRELTARRRDGEIALWGAGAKGVTFAATVDPTGELVTCLIDLNPKKQDSFAPVTACPIVAPAAAAARGVRTVVVMNPNYKAEIGQYIQDNKLPFQLLDG